MTSTTPDIQSEIGFNVEIAVGGLPRKRKTNSERRQAKREVIRLCQEQHSCEVVLNPRPAQPAPKILTCFACGLEINGDVFATDQALRESGPLFCSQLCVQKNWNPAVFDRAKLTGLLNVWR